MKVFSTFFSKKLGKKIAENLSVPFGEIEKTVFPDGETRIRVKEMVVDENIVLVACPGSDPDSFYMELFFTVDALKRSGASRVILVLPYLAYQRQDHEFREGEAVSLDVIAKVLKNVGVSELVTFDLHSIKIPEVFEIPVIHLSALPLFAKEIKKIGIKDSSLVSPDMGGIRRIKILSELLGNLPFATIEKDRDLESGKVSSIKHEGEIAKKVFIVDDVISTGRTIEAAIDLLKKNGAQDLYVFATHPVFSGNAKEILQNIDIKKIYVTDSIVVPKDKEFVSLAVLSIADTVSDKIQEFNL